MCRSRINLRGMPKLNWARRQRVRADADSRRPNCTGACSCAGSSLRASVSRSSAATSSQGGLVPLPSLTS
ncbi:MAG: hypothetical protein K0Q52_1758 [Microbacterium sp.]|nr:hypothetical protein [Microbacterium sp.]